MRLQKQTTKRPMLDFNHVPISYWKIEPIKQEDLIELINYMQSYGYKLGINFHFVMGADAPSSKFLSATAGPSKMVLVVSEIAAPEAVEHWFDLYLCIEAIKKDKQSTDHLEAWDINESDPQPFFPGQEVVGDGALPGSQIKNGQHYTIRVCHYSECKGKFYWYVGVEGIDHDWMTPRIFKAYE